ncbi:GNS1/SUR4 membrane protein family [Euphorbia peplus]|nr:GNS1/SUR4 membrane protein family [Euphorbia peplus]
MIETLRNISLSEHPSIVNFRWSITQTWGSTWSFLISVITIYIISCITLHLILSLLLNPRHCHVSLGPIPAIHSLIVALTSAFIFTGLLLSTVSEIRDTRWLWPRTKTTTAFQWLLCFPLGTRPTGRVFFWSYTFYLSRFLHLFRTLITIIQHRKLNFFTVFNQCILLIMSFLWLEFSQSFQVVAILLTTMLYSIVYGYRFLTAIGFPKARFSFELNCQIVVLGCNLVCNFGVVLLHFLKGGCNGMVAWSLNCVLNGVISIMFLRFYVNVYMIKKKAQQEYDVSSAHFYGVKKDD